MNLTALIKALSILGVRMGQYSGGFVAVDTWANVQETYPASNYSTLVRAFATDLGAAPGTIVVKQGALWRPQYAFSLFSGAATPGYINFGGSGATYSQTTTTVTVTQTSHGFTANQNGCSIYLTQSTGDLVSGWFTGFTYVNANSFTCTSTVSQTTDGNLGTSSGELSLPWSFAIPSGLAMATDASAISVTHLAKSSANNKTVKFYFNALAITAAGNTLTTGAAYTASSPAAQTFQSATTFTTSGLSTTPQSAGNRRYTVTSTLANAADWHVIYPLTVNFTPRYNP